MCSLVWKFLGAAHVMCAHYCVEKQLLKKQAKNLRRLSNKHLLKKQAKNLRLSNKAGKKHLGR